MPLDLNDAQEQRQEGVIPDGTFARLVFRIEPGQHSLPGSEQADPDRGIFTQSQSSDVIMLIGEFTILAGKWAKRKVFQNFTVFGGSVDEKGNSKGWNVTKSFIRAMVESATGTMPKDESPQAKAVRIVPSFSVLNGIEFNAKIGIEAGGDAPGGGKYADKNRIAHVVTPDEPEWQLLTQGKEVEPKPAGARRSGGGARSAIVSTPAWGGGGAPTVAPQAAWRQATQPATQPVQQAQQPVNPAPTMPAGPSWLTRQ